MISKVDISKAGNPYNLMGRNMLNQIILYNNTADGKPQDLPSLAGMGGGSVTGDNKRRAANQQRADRRVMNPADRGRRPRFRDV